MSNEMKREAYLVIMKPLMHFYEYRNIEDPNIWGIHVYDGMPLYIYLLMNWDPVIFLKNTNV